MYVCIYIYIYIYTHIHYLCIAESDDHRKCYTPEVVFPFVKTKHTYTRSPLEDSRLFGPNPWKILGTTYEQNDF